ncbi:MAG: hypothetical protein C4516_04685 [Oxalobacter sp.]|nr:MAG: hypothetical protein C4516_04685 [Oxalobacter sp.]
MTMLRLLTMLKTCFLALTFALSLPALAAPDPLPPPAMEVGFGYLGHDRIINRIMYYQQGEWQKPLSAFLSQPGHYSGVQPHDTIVQAWLNANTAPDSADVDCQKADLRKGENSHCLYTKKINKKLKDVSQEELAALLASTPPKVRLATTKELLQVLTPTFLGRLLAWKELKADKFDVEAYANVFWGAKSSVFTNWFDMRADVPQAITSESAVFLDPSTADCSTDSTGVKIQAGRFQSTKEGWVATQRWGYRWIPFEKLADLSFDPESGAADPANTEAPFPYNALLQQAKAQWEAAEGRTVPYKLKVRRFDTKKQLQTTPFRKLVVERAVSYQNRASLLLFNGEKSFRPQGASSGAALDIFYRSWAIRHPDGKVEWISSRLDLDPSGAALANVDEAITFISPHALLEIDGKQFVVAASNLHTTRNTIMRTEIFELLSGQFKSRAIYGETCGNPVSK